MMPEDGQRVNQSDESYTQAALTAIEETVGPSPWYWKTFPWITGRSGQRYLWKAQKDGPVTLTALIDTSTTRMVIGMYAAPFAIPQGLLGVWVSRIDRRWNTARVEVQCFNPDDLPEFSLTDPERSARVRGNTVTLVKPLNQFSIAGDLPSGLNAFECPDIFREAADLLIVANHRSLEDATMTALYNICFKNQTVESYPQKWFTADEFDIGYQWITRVTRHPQSGRFVGDGIRIGAFELTENGCDLERWLRGGPRG